MELYLASRQGAGVPRRPGVQEALEAGRVGELRLPTLAEGETYSELPCRPQLVRGLPTSKMPHQGYGFARIQRLAIEHLLGVR